MIDVTLFGESNVEYLTASGEFSATAVDSGSFTLYLTDGIKKLIKKPSLVNKTNITGSELIEDYINGTILDEDGNKEATVASLVNLTTKIFTTAGYSIVEVVEDSSSETTSYSVTIENYDLTSAFSYSKVLSDDLSNYSVKIFETTVEDGVKSTSLVEVSDLDNLDQNTRVYLIPTESAYNKFSITYTTSGITNAFNVEEASDASKQNYKGQSNTSTLEITLMQLVFNGSNKFANTTNYWLYAAVNITKKDDTTTTSYYTYLINSTVRLGSALSNTFVDFLEAINEAKTIHITLLVTNEENKFPVRTTIDYYDFADNLTILCSVTGKGFIRSDGTHTVSLTPDNSITLSSDAWKNYGYSSGEEVPVNGLKTNDGKAIMTGEWTIWSYSISHIVYPTTVTYNVLITNSTGEALSFSTSDSLTLIDPVEETTIDTGIAQLIAGSTCYLRQTSTTYEENNEIIVSPRGPSSFAIKDAILNESGEVSDSIILLGSHYLVDSNSSETIVLKNVNSYGVVFKNSGYSIYLTYNKTNIDFFTLSLSNSGTTIYDSKTHPFTTNTDMETFYEFNTTATVDAAGKTTVEDIQKDNKKARKIATTNNNILNIPCIQYRPKTFTLYIDYNYKDEEEGHDYNYYVSVSQKITYLGIELASLKEIIENNFNQNSEEYYNTSKDIQLKDSDLAFSRSTIPEKITYDEITNNERFTIIVRTSPKVKKVSFRVLSGNSVKISSHPQFKNYMLNLPYYATENIIKTISVPTQFQRFIINQKLQGMPLTSLADTKASLNYNYGKDTLSSSGATSYCNFLSSSSATDSETSVIKLETGNNIKNRLNSLDVVYPYTRKRFTGDSINDSSVEIPVSGFYLLMQAKGGASGGSNFGWSHSSGGGGGSGSFGLYYIHCIGQTPVVKFTQNDSSLIATISVNETTYAKIVCYPGGTGSFTFTGALGSGGSGGSIPAVYVTSNYADKIHIYTIYSVAGKAGHASFWGGGSDQTWLISASNKYNNAVELSEPTRLLEDYLFGASFYGQMNSNSRKIYGTYAYKSDRDSFYQIIPATSVPVTSRVYGAANERGGYGAPSVLASPSDGYGENDNATNWGCGANGQVNTTINGLGWAGDSTPSQAGGPALVAIAY